MLEVERNPNIEPSVFTEFLARCGWEDPEAAAKLGWLLAASEHWIVCKVDGEMIGFGRTTPVHEPPGASMSVLVDPRFGDTGLRGAIAYLLVERRESLALVPPTSLPAAAPGAYLGKGLLDQIKPAE